MKSFNINVPVLTLQAALYQLRRNWARPFQEVQRISKLETFYAGRVTNMVSTAGHYPGSLQWLATCPMCERRSFFASPVVGDWCCVGPCSNAGMPDKLEYLLYGDMNRAVSVSSYLGYAPTVGTDGTLPTDVTSQA